jgi:hypothetical protein
MVNVRPVAVRVEPVAVERGLWCMRCMLSTGVRVWVAVSLGDQSHLQERLYCRECESGAHVINDRR